MPHVNGGRKSTYLLISGLRVQRRVLLCEGRELLPFDQNTPPKDYLAGLELLDKQFALLALPWVQCQLRVVGSGEEAVARRAWNALWDVLLLNAIFNVRVSCGLQSTAAMERFTSKSRLNVIHYRVFDPPEGDGYLLTENDCTWLEKNFSRAQDLLDQHRFQTAVHCLSTFNWHSLPRAQLALIWAGIESLFAIESEISFRVSLYAAKFLEPTDPPKQREVFADFRRLYEQRSKAVHGGKIKGDAQAGVRESANFLSRLVRTCIECDALPDGASLVP